MSAVLTTCTLLMYRLISSNPKPYRANDPTWPTRPFAVSRFLEKLPINTDLRGVNSTSAGGDDDNRLISPNNRSATCAPDSFFVCADATNGPTSRRVSRLLPAP